ncbi:hypothetical protein B566_EDAN012732 [Ephemera danica]|nr:hypothetical protein B566_EDAN012732 [Ephemera danica]
MGQASVAPMPAAMMDATSVSWSHKEDLCVFKTKLVSPPRPQSACGAMSVQCATPLMRRCETGYRLVTQHANNRRASAHEFIQCSRPKAAKHQFLRSASSVSLQYPRVTKVWEHDRQSLQQQQHGMSSAGPISPLVGPGPRATVMQAVEYYTSTPQQALQGPGRPPQQQQQSPQQQQQDVARPRGGASITPTSSRGRFSGVRASYNERMATRYQPHHHHHHHTATPLAASPNVDLMYRSNSSLELEGDGAPELASVSSMAARREYGSHGSIDVLGDGPSPGGSSFFALLQDFKHRAAPPDQRSPGPARIADVLRGKLEPPPASENATNALQVTNGTTAISSNGSNDSLEPDAASPKLRNKLHKFWGDKAGKQGKAEEQPPSLFRKLRGRSQQADDTTDCGLTVAGASDEERERQRRRAFAHYDCQSVTANLPSAASRLRSLLLLRRRNTATGASAASMRASTPDAPLTNGSSEHLEEDTGDGRSNELIESCPYFRNEVGGEEEREVGLTRFTPSQRRPGPGPLPMLHRPPLAYGVSVLESAPSETHWRGGACPYQRPPRPIEGTDQGALYYRLHFHGQEHQNWFGLDDNLGPVAISVKREKVEENSGSNQPDSSGPSLYQFRVIVRTSELLTLRGAILEEAIPTAKSSSGKSVSTKELLEYVAPEIQLSCLRLGTSTSATEDQLAKLDEQGLSSHYKVGVMYCRAGQATEEEMYNNEDAGPAFHEFLETIGQRVRLRGFEKYKAGLDNKTDSTGLYSVYAQYQDSEIMFHVSTLLPFTPNNRQQLLRKRHIGNDIVTIVFQEPGAQPFTPKNIRSQFQHVFIVVQAANPCSENTHYRVAVSRSKDVPVFGPPILDGATFPRSKAFADFLLAKVINAENAAHRSEKFATMATRTRQEYLKDLVANHCTSTAIETNQKFSIMSFSSKKKDRVGGTPRRGGALEAFQQRGAVVWQVVLDDSGLSSKVECLLAISADTLVLIEEQSREIVFVSPCRSILGWSANANSLRVYYHQGECVTLHVRPEGERDELMEVVVRLRAVTVGCPAQELALRRNGVGQLGFHVQPDGVVTQVEPAGLAWQAGLRQGARLVEICKVAVSTLSHDQMVDLLKTSIMVTVTVIPPLADGSSRRGCSLPNCKYTLGNYEGDYENVNGQDDGKVASKPAATYQQAGNHRKRFERSLSPPRSSNSSGYGTGSSSKSFTGRDSRFPSNPEGTMTSSSSGHSGDERWYEVMEPSESGDSPPPLPVRLGSGGNSAFHQVKQSRGGQILESAFPPAPIQAFPTLPPECGIRGVASHSDTHSTGTNSPSDRLLGARSEDELSAGSGSNLSPRLRRGKRSDMTLTPSSGSSRNQSPRTVGSTTPGGRSDSGEARLRPGVTGRSAGSNRNSASLNTSTLQEDLMRLINPDYLAADDRTSQEDSCKLNGKVPGLEGPSSLRLASGRSRSRENLAVGSALSMLTPADVASGSTVSVEKTGEVIFTTARPATVISNASTASSPAPSEIKLSKEERLSPRVTKLPATKLPLPDAREMDWPSLVDTAARAMLSETTSTRTLLHDSPPTARSVLNDGPSPGGSSSGNTTSSADTVPEAARNGERLGHWVDDVAERLGLDTAPNSSQQTVQAHVATLESRVARETRRRLSLEDEVRRLRDENRRLQEESQAAAQQLRRFTEWFFQTLDKH